MKNEKASFDVLSKIQNERLKRGWTEYTLAKNSDLSQSTVSSWYRKGLEPSLASLERICNGFGITLSQFFATDEYTTGLSNDQTLLLEMWEKLSPEQIKALLLLLYKCLIMADIYMYYDILYAVYLLSNYRTNNQYAYHLCRRCKQSVISGSSDA